MATQDPFNEIETFFAVYREAVYNLDIDAIDSMFEYPYLLSDDAGVREMPDIAFYRAICEALRESGAATSRDDSFHTYRMGKDGAAVMIRYTRTHVDGSVMKQSRATYLLRHRPDGWKFVGILDQFSD